MKRTGEFTLGIIGMICSALFTFVGLLILWSSKSDEFISLLITQAENDPTMNPEDIDIEAVISFMAAISWPIIIAALLGVIFGLIAVINIKGNKNSKLVGWMFIIGAVLVGVISLGLGFLPAILYLIAGIMCFVRKPLVNHDPTETNF